MKERLITSQILVKERFNQETKLFYGQIRVGIMCHMPRAITKLTLNWASLLHKYQQERLQENSPKY